jgi:hypothetical protein
MLFGRLRRVEKVKKAKVDNGEAGRAATLAPYVTARVRLKRLYKGRLYRAVVRADGRIRYNGSVFTSPSRAAREVCGHATDGWHFWQYERAPGDWVPINELRGRRRK